MPKIKCTANRGKVYIVEFDDNGELVSVDVVTRRGRDYGSYKRQIYHRRTQRPISLTVHCARNAALRVQKESSKLYTLDEIDEERRKRRAALSSPNGAKP